MPLNCGGTCEADAMGIAYLDGLYGYAMALTRNHAQAEDLRPRSSPTQPPEC
jgi:RNA polymerase sigma-70 factor (ECF subfamily)